MSFYLSAFLFMYVFLGLLSLLIYYVKGLCVLIRLIICYFPHIIS